MGQRVAVQKQNGGPLPPWRSRICAPLVSMSVSVKPGMISMGYPPCRFYGGEALAGRNGPYRSRTGGNEWEALTNGLPQGDCYVNVLRNAMAVDALDPCGVYFGTTGGQVYASANAGDRWAPIVRDLPAVLSVEVQTLP